MKYIVIVFLRNILKVFFIFPIKSNRIVFTSYSGRQFSCNPKYIFNKLKEEDDNFDLIWAFNNPDSYLDTCDAQLVKYKSIKYIYNVLTAHFVVENFESWSILPKRKKQFVINTWHGGGAYKKVGIDRKDARVFNEKLLRYKNKRVNLYLSSSQKFTDFTIRDSFKFEGEVAEIGMPRNDMLINGNKTLYLRTKEELGLKNENIVLIAPTFRAKTGQDVAKLDFESLILKLSKKFGGEWRVLFRSHYYSDIAQNSVSSKILDVTDYPDMQELLLISDVLITDYSSSMWDFSLKQGVVFLYATDLYEYNKNEREFYTPISSWPFTFASSFDELLTNIDNFSEDEYAREIAIHHKDLGSYETGEATELIYRILLKKLKE